ncbi:MAG: DUF4835 family protein [Bacteroidetes bacterium]|nr:DUF4835 family protein [Bacteroidota bacterium]
MSTRKKIFLFCNSIALFFLPSLWEGKGMGFCFAQELNCSVQVISPQLNNSADKKILQTLQQSIFEFMNNRKWTNDVFQQDERIECSVVITITAKSSDVFDGSIQVQARRPVYKSSYNSLLLNVLDKNLSFRYVEYQPLEFVENTFTANLTSVLAYYANVIIGADYDSFSLEGGTPYYQKAQAIVSNAQSASEKGWKFNEDDHNRYWIVENILNSTFKPLRECMYKYHRTGFDAMAEDLITGRATVLSSLELLKKVYDSKPNSYSLTLFFLAKADEIVNLFTLAEPAEKTKLLALVNEIDPANNTKYNKINQSKE